MRNFTHDISILFRSTKGNGPFVDRLVQVTQNMQFHIVLLAVLAIHTVWGTADITEPVPYQTCDPAVNNGNCSSMPHCRCEEAATGERICTQQMSCVYAAACNPNDSCDKPGTICVLDSRCSGQRLCYSTVLFSPELCPPINATDAGGS